MTEYRIIFIQNYKKNYFPLLKFVLLLLEFKKIYFVLILLF